MKRALGLEQKQAIAWCMFYISFSIWQAAGMAGILGDTFPVIGQTSGFRALKMMVGLAFLASLIVLAGWCLCFASMRSPVRSGSLRKVGQRSALEMLAVGVLLVCVGIVLHAHIGGWELNPGKAACFVFFLYTYFFGRVSMLESRHRISAGLMSLGFLAAFILTLAYDATGVSVFFFSLYLAVPPFIIMGMSVFGTERSSYS